MLSTWTRLFPQNPTKKTKPSLRGNKHPTARESLCPSRGGGRARPLPGTANSAGSQHPLRYGYFQPVPKPTETRGFQQTPEQNQVLVKFLEIGP